MGCGAAIEVDDSGYGAASGAAREADDSTGGRHSLRLSERRSEPG